LAEELTAQYLIDKGIGPITPNQLIRTELRRHLRSLKEEGVSHELMLQKLFPNTILETETLESLVSALLAGNHVIFFGPPGSGKTNLAKDVWDFFPKEVYVVEGCPVQDDPFSIFDTGFAKEVPPCPFCTTRFGKDVKDSKGIYDPSSVDPKDVPISLVTLKEGFGFARIQGSPEVFPDNLTGTINLHRLEEIGDPTSPLILEPGKLLQSNRGLLIIDEIGKLPRGTQNVLLQALQEHIVTPAKSRETFPASFIAVCTSNIDDLDNINEPLNDRLTNIYIGFNQDYMRNRLVLDLALTSRILKVGIPEIYLDAATHLIMMWRSSFGDVFELTEVGSNRTLIDIVTRSEAFGLLKSEGMISSSSFRRGVLNAMLGRVRARGGDSFAQNTLMIEQFVEKEFLTQLQEAGRRYWCEYFKTVLDANKQDGKKTLSQCEKLRKNTKLAKEMLKGENRFKHAQRFAGYVKKKEQYSKGVKEEKVFLHTLNIMEKVSQLDCAD